MLELANGYYELPPGKLANVVICLEMKTRPRVIGPGLPGGFALQRLGANDVATHRAVFRDVGLDYLWFSRLVMAEDLLKSTLADLAVESFVLMQSDTAVGILELNFRVKGECELALLGVSPKAIGVGLGKALMNEALSRAWARPINRLWLHTCHYDHPRALNFYQAAGFKAYARMIEIHDDPRLSGQLPLDAAPHVPGIDRGL